MNFQELGLCAPLLRAVAAEGYTVCTPIQAQAIPHLMAGRDLSGCAQTGTGKTAAFVLPLVHRLTHAGNPPRGRGRRIRMLVLSPTRELAAQIADSCQSYGRHTPLRYAVVHGGVSQHPQTRALRNGIDVLIATPGRLCDLINQGHIDLSAVEAFVLDEADRMLDMGFLPDLRRIIQRLPARRQNVFFSATMPPAIESLAGEILRDPVHVRVSPVKATTELITQSVCFVTRQEKTGLLSNWLATRCVDRALVFTRTKQGADRLTRQLNKSGVAADAIHGNKSQAARQRVLADFKANRKRVLVATDVAARGIDVDGISHVFNYDLPREPETYLHRIGRTGRAGAAGVAVSFCDRDERGQLKAIERLIRQTLAVEPSPAASGAAERPPAPRPPRPSNRPRPSRRGDRAAQVPAPAASRGKRRTRFQRLHSSDR